jgi:hypothetical protein
LGVVKEPPYSLKERKVCMERTEIKVGKITITITDKDSLMVELDGYTYFIDNSTNENLINRYKDK